MGRPSKLTPEREAKILQLLRDGNFREVAVRAVRVSYPTFCRWMKCKSKRYRNFRKAVLEAEQEAEIAMVAVVRSAAYDDAKHAEWWLERKVPDRWGKKETRRQEITGKDGGPIESKTQVEHTGKLTLQESVERYQKELAHDADMEAADSTSSGDGDRQPVDTPPSDPPTS